MVRVNSTTKESTTNFSPANGTGLAVRTAIKDILEALRTVNSDTGDPSGSANLAAYQMHINTTNESSNEAILKIRNGTNTGFVEIGNVLDTNLGLLSKGGGVMTGALQASAGSQSAPAINFGDSSTGFYRAGSNILGVSCGDTDVFQFTNNNSISKQDLTISKIDNDNAVLNIVTNTNNKSAHIDLVTSTQATNPVGFDFGFRLLREAGVNGNSLIHHRSDSATAQNLIINSQARSSGGILFKTGGTPHVNAASEVPSTTRLSILHNGGILAGEAITNDPVSATGDVGNGMKFVTASATEEYGSFGLVVNAKDIVGIFNRTNTTGKILEFKSDGSTVVGDVSTNGSTTNYNGNSDYRLKQDINNIDNAITKIKTLRPVTFRWKNNVDIGYDNGFIAHEVQETGHYNHLVTGVKDGTRTSHSNPEKTEPQYQGVDYGKFTPMLVAALQEAVAKIETLETKVAALEAS